MDRKLDRKSICYKHMRELLMFGGISVSNFKKGTEKWTEKWTERNKCYLIAPLYSRFPLGLLDRLQQHKEN